MKDRILHWLDSILKNNRVIFYVEWVSTFILIVGVILTSWNIYPLNIYLSLVGNLGWFIVGIAWRKLSLIIIQIVLTLIYIAGIMSNT
jgi:hypothetical protein